MNLSNRPTGVMRLALSIFICILVANCTKTDLTLTNNRSDGRVPAALRPQDRQVRRVMDEFTIRSAGKGGKDLLKAFVERYGTPLWDKSILIPRGNPGSRDTMIFQADTILLIPVLDPEVREIQTYIEAVLTDNVELSVHTDDEYTGAHFSTAASYVNEAERIAIRFMILNRLVFDFRTFQILDKRLFHGSDDYGDTAGIGRKIKLNDGNSNAMQYMEVCIDVISTTYHCPYLFCNGPDGTCDECPECVTTQTVTICQGWWQDGGGGTGGGGTGGGGTGGGGGGSGGGGGGDPCRGYGKILERELPCDGGGDDDDDGWDPEEDEPEDPCVSIIPQAMVLDNLSQNVKYLNAKSSILNAASDGNEHAVTFGRDAIGNITTSSMTTGTPTSATVFPDWPGGFADLHNHTQYTIPSAGDLYKLVAINKVHHGYGIRMVVLPNESTYALVVTNRAGASIFVDQNPSQQVPGYPPNFPNTIFDEFYNVKADIQAQGYSELIAEEMTMAFVLEKYHMGVALMKQDANGNFKRLRTQANGTGSNVSYAPNNCL